MSQASFVYAVLSLWLVLRLALFCEVWVFPLVTDLPSGIVRFWPSMTCACGGCAVWVASVTLVELGQRLLRLLVLLLRWRGRVLVTVSCAPSYSSFLLGFLRVQSAT